MAGLKPNSLKSLSERSLNLYACVDNNEKGIKFISDNGLIPCNRILAENSVKDFNELLQTIERNREAQEKGHGVQAAEKSPPFRKRHTKNVSAKIGATSTEQKNHARKNRRVEEKSSFAPCAQKDVSDFWAIFSPRRFSAVRVQGVSPCEMYFWLAKPPKSTIEYSTY